MYTEATNRQSGAKARIMTPIYTKTTPLCLEFWYHLNGAHIGTLNVYTQVCDLLLTVFVL